MKLPLILLLLVVPGAMAGDEGALELRSAPFTFREDLAGAAAPAFGSENSQWLTFGAGVAHDFSKANDYNLRFAWSQFLIDDVEFSLEGNLWYFDQKGDNAVGFNPAMVFRWHFINTSRWSVYGDLGVGLLLATEAVPDGGTDIDFTPRAGVGLTYQLSESDPMRLQVGLRWHHISNARFTGDEKNPARDAPMLYAGVMIPF
jgi:hypothetical protein